MNTFSSFSVFFFFFSSFSYQLRFTPACLFQAFLIPALYIEININKYVRGILILRICIQGVLLRIHRYLYTIMRLTWGSNLCIHLCPLHSSPRWLGQKFDWLSPNGFGLSFVMQQSVIVPTPTGTLERLSPGSHRRRSRSACISTIRSPWSEEALLYFSY